MFGICWDMPESCDNVSLTRMFLVLDKLLAANPSIIHCCPYKCLYISTFLSLHSARWHKCRMSAVEEQDCGVEKRNIPHDEWIMFGLPTWTATRWGAAISAELSGAHGQHPQVSDQLVIIHKSLISW